ncbi:MAG: cupin domain-containing protein [Bacteroidota bacterium]|nr:cupin domain-containing protein [Bacteroidota bacterium]MDP4231486.1 cupin domain-containing protein [Bacteroidota bacterium]
MNKFKLFPLILLLGLFLGISTSAFAQDPVSAASNVYKKVLLDNDKVRVIEVEFAPGEVTAWHHHPNHVVYALTDGKIEITDKGKPAFVADIKAGTAMYLPAVTHMAKNIGTTTVKLVVTEIKPSAHKKESGAVGAPKK